jgi:hypothetical protein
MYSVVDIILLHTIETQTITRIAAGRYPGADRRQMDNSASDGARRSAAGLRGICTGGSSQCMLTVTLRNLEHDGILIRTVYLTIPLRVEYELSDRGG